MPKVNERDLDWSTMDARATRFLRKRLAAAAGGEEIGASFYELPLGEQSWPYHYHTANEEALYCFAGAESLRLAGEHGEIETVDFEAGDYVALPTDERGGHHVANDGDEPLRYLAVSTMTEPDVIGYPDADRGFRGCSARERRRAPGPRLLPACMSVEFYPGLLV